MIMTADRRTSGITQARRAIAILVVLGLTWIFGVLAINDARLAFKYLFCVFISLQGLLVFIFYFLLLKDNKKTRKKLRRNRMLGTLPVRQRHPSSSSRFQEVVRSATPPDHSGPSLFHSSSNEATHSKDDNGNSSHHMVSTEVQ